VIVEDHLLFARGLTAVLEADGLAVAGVARGVREGAEMVGRLVPDAVVIDLFLEDGSGLDLIARLRAEHGEKLTLVVLTGSHDPEHMLAAVRAGADGYLTKDVSPDRLPVALRGAIAGEAAISRTMAAHLLRDARSGRLAAVRRPRRERLTPRQLEVLQMIAAGSTTGEIAQSLYLSPETVRWHVKAILRKLGARTRAEAVAVLHEVGAASASPAHS
jgi:DNA-binding NarL/FixJ family response regulator